jgi:hypothetical protein
MRIHLQFGRGTCAAAKSPLCRSCNQPFVAVQRTAGVYGLITVTRKICPDCRQNLGGDPVDEMDCVVYMRDSRVGARLVDGYRLRAGVR